MTTVPANSGDLLDPDDFIFPRAATRVGPKYQVNSFPVAGVENQYPAGMPCFGYRYIIVCSSVIRGRGTGIGLDDRGLELGKRNVAGRMCVYFSISAVYISIHLLSRVCS